MVSCKPFGYRSLRVHLCWRVSPRESSSTPYIQRLQTYQFPLALLFLLPSACGEIEVEVYCFLELMAP